jgi:hypothetical protein
MGVFTTTAKTWGAEALKSSDLNAQVRDFINGFGTWTTYTPTFAGAGTTPTVGTGGTANGAYLQVNKLVIFRLVITFGSSASWGSSGSVSATLPPVTASSNNTSYQSIGTWSGQLWDSTASATNTIQGQAIYSSQAFWFGYTLSPASGTRFNTGFINNSFATPVSGNKIGVTGMYEAA